MKLADVKYSQQMENTESKSFKDLAEKLQGTVSFDMPPFLPCFFSSVIFSVCRGLLLAERRSLLSLMSVSEA